MRAIMQELVDAATAASTDDRCELMTAISDRYPIQVMCHILGIPPEDQDDFARWNASMTWALSAEVGAHMEEIEWGFGNMGEYVAALAADRRREPRDDMVTTLVQAEEADDRLTEDEVQTLIASLLFAGHDTTRNQLGLAMWLFAEHPDQWQLLGAQPELVPQAVEEVVRFAAAVNMTPRLTVEAVELDGYRIPQGTLVAVSLNGANHDPEVYVEPFTFDITQAREPINSFGGGRHYCLGASLARAELQEALKILGPAMPGVELDGEPTWRSAMGIFGPERLPLRWGAMA
jgi:cytochrome P450